MIRITFSPRFFFVAIFILILSACGPRIGNTFSTIGNSLPGDAEPTQGSPSEALPTATLIFIPPPSYPPPSHSPSFIPTALPAIPERRRITLEFPPQIRAGDSDRIRLTIEVDDLGNLTPTAEVGGNLVTGEVIEIPNLYETHSVIAEARFDIAGLRVSPPDLVSQPLAQGQSISFYWSILPDGVGVYRGTVWLYLRFVDNVSGEESRRAVSAQPIEIEAVNFFGLSGGLARTFGVVGSIAGTIIGFPFLEDIIKFLSGRRGREKR